MTENITSQIAFSASSFIGGATVQITCQTSGASIYYTTDDSTPSSSNGTLYSAPFAITKNTTVKAVAVKEGLLDSEVASVTIEIALPTPVPKKTAGNKIDNCYLSIENLSDYTEYGDVEFHYTDDGTEPTEEGGSWSGEGLWVQSNKTFKFKAFCTGYSPSATATLVVDDLKVCTPVISEVSE